MEREIQGFENRGKSRVLFEVAGGVEDKERETKRGRKNFGFDERGRQRI